MCNHDLDKGSSMTHIVRNGKNITRTIWQRSGGEQFETDIPVKEFLAKEAKTWNNGKTRFGFAFISLL